MIAGLQRRWLVLALAFLIVAITGAAVTRAGDSLVTTRELADPDAILVLASHEWERLPQAAETARDTPSAAVLLTVPREITELNCHRCAERSAWLSELGISPQRVQVLPLRVSNTHDEARSALEYARLRGVQRLLVVTSPYHTRRAIATFDRVFAGSGIAVGVQPSSGYSRAVPARWWTTAYDRSYVRYEWAALIFYTVRYGVLPGVASYYSRSTSL